MTIKKQKIVLFIKDPTFLISGTLGAKRCEICKVTSWISAWFFIVFLAFMILGYISLSLMMKGKRKDEPNDGGLNDVFAVLVDCFQDVGGFSLDFSFDG